jgi:hypothetical protein
MTEINFKELAPEKFVGMSTWCKEEFGHPALWETQLNNSRSPAKWICRGDYPKELFGPLMEPGSAVFKFREGRDATMFALKWS